MSDELGDQLLIAREQAFAMGWIHRETMLLDPADRAACCIEVDIHDVILLAEERGEAQWKAEHARSEPA